MDWGCFSGTGVGDLPRIKGIMKKEQYKSILIRHAVPSGRRIVGQGFTFQADNDPKHASLLPFLCDQFCVRAWTIIKLANFMEASRRSISVDSISVDIVLH